MSQIYPRYCVRDFERGWQTRLKTPPRTTNNASRLHVEVTHRFPAPNRYSWELRHETGRPVEESRVQFASWEEASQAGKLALKQRDKECAAIFLESLVMAAGENVGFVLCVHCRLCRRDFVLACRQIQARRPDGPPNQISGAVRPAWRSGTNCSRCSASFST
jgi:hypothetical protein